MAKLAKFDGIIIRMFSEPVSGSRHHRPHFHARYSGNEAVYTIDQIEQLVGSLPINRHRQVMEWAEEHRIELEPAWDLLQKGERPDPIGPLE